ncbi:helicase-exonuclease AddAB subunit AddB [Clostridium aciditolerans]|uniref:ATP-dependent helicase/deoxyribonuclease subunit B n=1 Tax=Clostridium aciditolerans TaxID=339861 RepID=A0A934M7N7_9CLOT|nr:helicase-exonuclease AddAB subunit AddB [Clostridium aciditolerans]MBI6874141.1 helicase-exonuclease AddAB subunit AddB [Clostridium aciditolerans]
MSLRFIFGRAGSGKSYYCLNDIKKKVEEGCSHPLVLLVPEQFSFQAEKNLIKTVGEEGMLKAQVLSFKRMAYTVCSEVGGLSRQHINSSGRSMLLYKIMSENKDKLKVFGKTAKKQGFVTTVCDIITEFKRYNITIELLNSALDRVESENLKNKIQDLILIFSEFEERLHRNYIDTEDDLTILAEKIDKCHLFDGAEIWIDEFSSFTPQQYIVIEKLMSKAKRVNMTLCTDCLNGDCKVENTDIFSTTKNTEQKLLEIIQRNNIKYDKPIALKCSPCYRFKDSEELQHLQHYLFSYPYKAHRGEVSDLHIIKALNKYVEIEETARDIIRICRDKGFRFRDIAVVSGDLDGYENLVRAIFSEYNIPYFIDKKREIVNNPIIVLIVSAAEILARNWSYECVFRYLKTGLLDLSNEEIDILENYVLANGIRGKRWIDENPWDYRINYDFEDEEISDDEKELLNKINEIRYKVIRPLIILSENIKGRKKGIEMCEGLYQFLCEIQVPEKLEHWISAFKELGELDKSNEYAQIWDIVVEVLDQIVEVVGDNILSMDEFSRILATGFGEYEIGVIPPALDQVLVGSVTRLKSHDVSALYIVGVNDGIFPAAVPSEGILTDVDREGLREGGLELAKDTRSRAFEEQFLVYTTLTIVSKYLRLSYAMSDEEGKAKRPSIIISRIKKVFPDILEQSCLAEERGDNENIKAITGPNATFNELVSNIKKDSQGEYISPLWLDVYRWYKNNSEWSEKLDSVLNGFSYTNKAEILDTSKVRKLYGRNMSISVSRLEKYVECPFAYFMQYGLKAKSRKIYNFSSPDLGSFMHNILQSFSVMLKEHNLSWKDIDREWCENSINDIVNSTISKIPGSILSSSKRYGHVAKGLKRILTRSVWLITEHMKRGGFTPKGYELSFSNSGDYPPITVELHSGETVSLIGRVDRIDSVDEEKATYLRIVDYKSGTREFKLSDVYYGLQMQLLIYLDAMLTELEERINKDALPGGILYFKLDDPIIKGKGELSDSEIEKRIMKSLKMNGLLLDNLEVIKEMDSEIEKSSDIIPVTIKKDGEISKSQSSVATLEQFQLLRKYVKDTIAELCEHILEGNIDINPCKKKNKNSCEYCIYPAICQFDTTIKDNKYRILEDKSNEEVWQAIEEKLNN